jgi:predicted phosphodiesterase
MAEGTPFGVFGDVPYSAAEIRRVEQLIEEMNAAPLAFVVHVGDIGSSSALQACGDAWVLERKKQFARIRHPFVLVPGDNEWSDCKDPLQRLRQWRQLFCLSDSRLKFESQKGEYCEHIRWESGGTLFVVLNVAGSNNNLRHAEHAPRMAAVMAWLDESAARAEGRGLRLAVVMHANPFVTTPRDGYAALREKLAALGARRGGKVVLIHGDTHVYRDDEPIPGVRRIEVWGSPFVSWLRLAF